MKKGFTIYRKIQGFSPLILLIPIAVLLLFVTYFFLVLKDQPSDLLPPGSVILSPIPTQIPATPTPDPTTNWKTFTYSSNRPNGSITFSFKHPNNWRTQGPLTDNDAAIQYFFSNGTIKTQSPELEPYIFVSEKYELPNVDLTQETVNNFEIYKTTDLPGRFGVLTHMIKYSDNYYVSISLTPYEDNPIQGQKEGLEILNQILSTFKFIE